MRSSNCDNSSYYKNGATVPSIIHAADSASSLVSVITVDQDDLKSNKSGGYHILSPSLRRPTSLRGMFRGFSLDSPLSDCKPERKHSKGDLRASSCDPQNPCHNATFAAHSGPTSKENGRFLGLAFEPMLITTMESPSSRLSSKSTPAALAMPVRKSSKKSFSSMMSFRKISHPDLQNSRFESIPPEGNKSSLPPKKPRKFISPLFFKATKTDFLPLNLHSSMLAPKLFSHMSSTSGKQQ